MARVHACSVRADVLDGLGGLEELLVFGVPALASGVPQAREDALSDGPACRRALDGGLLLGATPSRGRRSGCCALVTASRNDMALRDRSR
jgi:hypothetical protein